MYIYIYEGRAITVSHDVAGMMSQMKLIKNIAVQSLVDDYTVYHFVQVHELEIDYTTGCKPTDTSKGTDCSEYLKEVNRTLEPYPTCQCEWEFTLDEDFKVCLILYYMYCTSGKLEKAFDP